jgi:hypothetical protein
LFSIFPVAWCCVTGNNGWPDDTAVKARHHAGGSEEFFIPDVWYKNVSKA